MTAILNTLGNAARNGTQSRDPGLWRGLTAAWAPPLGRSWSVPCFGPCRSPMKPASTAPLLGNGRYGGEWRFTASANEQWQATGTVNHFAYPHVTGVFTAAVLCRLGATGTNKMLVDSCNGTSANKGFYLYVSSANKFEGFVARGGGTVYNFSSSGTLAANVWYLLVIVANGTTMRAYLNGQLDSATASAGTLGSGDATFDLTVGRYANAATAPHNGSIAGVWQWNRALLANEVQRLTADPFRMFERRPVSVARLTTGARRRRLLTAA